MTKQNESQFQESSSPTRTQKGLSPLKRKTLAGGLASTASPTLKAKGSLTLKSPSKLKDKGEMGEGKQQEGLSSPTSISMQNTFLIKNAD